MVVVVVVVVCEATHNQKRHKHARLTSLLCEARRGERSSAMALRVGGGERWRESR